MTASPAKAASLRGPRLPSGLQTALWAASPSLYNSFCRRRYGPVFEAKMFPFGRVVTIAEPDLVRQVLTGDPNLFRAGDANSTIAFVVGQESVLMLDGDDHAQMRRTLTPPFHREAIACHVDMIRSITEEEVSTWRVGETIKLQERLQRITLEIMIRIVLGVADADRRAALRRLVPQLLHVSPLLMVFPAIRRQVLGKGPWDRFLEVRRELDDVVFAEISKARASDNAERVDSLSLLLRGETGMGISDDAVRDHLVTLLVVGHETTSTALAWLFERVVRHPSVMRKLAAEGSESIRGHHPYLDATIKESLRIRPVTMDVARTLAEPATIGGFDLDAGTMIAISIGLLHRSPDIFPDPDAFRPERFMHESRPPFHYLPFGGGQHRCMGANFAMLEMQVITSTILAMVRMRAPRRTSEGARSMGPMILPSRGAEVEIVDRIVP